MVNSKNQWSAVELGKFKVKSKTMLLSASNIVISNIVTHIISISFWIITDIFVISNYLHLKKKVFKIYALFNVKKKMDIVWGPWVYDFYEILFPKHIQHFSFAAAAVIVVALSKQMYAKI